MGRASQTAPQPNGGYSGHSVVENNREDEGRVCERQQQRTESADHFACHDHMQGGKPIYRGDLIAGYTGTKNVIQTAILREINQSTLFLEFHW